MAHFLIYKRPQEITSYEVDFEDLLTSSDTKLDTDLTNVKVVDSAGVDQTKYFLQQVVIDLLNKPKKVTAVLVNGLNGEDYLVYFDAFGDVSFKTNSPNRVLEVRVRTKLSGNL